MLMGWGPEGAQLRAAPVGGLHASPQPAAGFGRAQHAHRAQPPRVGGWAGGCSMLRLLSLRAAGRCVPADSCRGYLSRGAEGAAAGARHGGGGGPEDEGVVVGARVPAAPYGGTCDGHTTSHHCRPSLLPSCRWLQELQAALPPVDCPDGVRATSSGTESCGRRLNMHAYLV